MNIFATKSPCLFFLKFYSSGKRERERKSEREGGGRRERESLVGRTKSVVSQAADVHVRTRFSARPERLIWPLQEQRGEYVSGAIRARGHRFVSLKRLEAEDFVQSVYREPCTCCPAGIKDRWNSAQNGPSSRSRILSKRFFLLEKIK